MGAIKDTYDIIKDLLNEAKKLKNYDFAEKVIEIQQRFFDLNNENQDMKKKIIEQDKVLSKLHDIHKQIDDIKKENSQLEQKLSLYEKTDDLAFLDLVISSKYTEIRYVYASGMGDPIVNNLEETLKDIYLSVAPKMLTPKDDTEFETLFEKSINGTYSYLDETSIGKIKAKFLQHGLIEIKDSNRSNVKIQLTEFGKQVLNKLND